MGAGYGKTADGYSGTAGRTAIGAQNTDAGFQSGSTSGHAHIGDAYYGKQELSGSAGESNGVYHADGRFTSLRGVDNVDANLNTRYGNLDAHVGNYSRGEAYSGGGSYDSNTGVSELHGSKGGPIARDVRLGYTTADGQGGGNVGVGTVTHGVEGEGRVQYDPRTGTASADGRANIGGLAANDVTASGHYGDSAVNLRAGQISSDTQITNAHAEVDRNHARASGDYDGGGVRIRQFDGAGTFGSGPNQVTASSHIGEFGNTSQVKGAFADVNYADPHNPSLSVGAREIAVGPGLWGENMSADVHGPGGSAAHASLGSFSDGLEAKDASATLSRNGLTADVREANYSSFRMKDADVSAGTADYNARAHLGGLNTNSTTVNGGHLDAGLDHLNVSAREAGYQTVGITNASVDQHYGTAYNSHASLGEGHYNSFHGENVTAGLDRNGLHASLDNGSYSYAGGKNLDLSNSIAGGAVTSNLHVGEASVGGINAGHLDYSTTLQNTNLSATNLSAHGARISDLHGGQTVGDVGVNYGARTLNALDLSVGQLDAHSRNFGTAGDAHVQNANLDVLNVQGGHAGFSRGGQEIAGVSGDYRAGGSVADASAQYDVMNGTASGQFRDAHLGAQMNNASLNLMGHNIALPNAGVDVRASGSGSVDARHGRAEGNVGLGGSSVNVGGTRLTVPDFVQANGAIDASRGAARAQVGGANGVGGSMDLSRGQLEVNAFGQRVDVAGGVRDMANGASNLAQSAWNSLPHIEMPKISLPRIW